MFLLTPSLRWKLQKPTLLFTVELHSQKQIFFCLVTGVRGQRASLTDRQRNSLELATTITLDFAIENGVGMEGLDSV